MKNLLLTTAILLLMVSVSYCENQNQQFIVKSRKPEVILEINRNAKNDIEKQMIGIAENVYPARSEIEGFIKKAHFGLKEIPADKKFWWYGEADDVRIPYCITADAVAYYQALAERARNEEWESNIEPRLSFNYTASVQLKEIYQNGTDKFSDVYVVELKFMFGKVFGSEGGVGFEKVRTVVINKQRKVLKVFGDGETGIWFK